MPELTSLAEVTDDTVLKENLDYGSFPSWDSSECAPVYARLRLGTPPTVRFTHLPRISLHLLTRYRTAVDTWT